MTIKNIFSKRYQLAAAALMAGTVLSVTSCTKGFDDMNVNPNQASAEKVNSDVLLATQLFRTGMDVGIHQRIQNLYCDIFSQYDANEGFSTQQYIPNAGWNTTYWSADYHVGWVKNLNEVIRYEREKRGGKSNILHIARIVKVLVSSWFTDIYGNVPYSQLADGSFQPAKYDNQSDIYADMLKELKEASDSLNNDYFSLNSSQDMIYSGDISKWKKFANSLRLRLAIRLTQVDPATAQKNAEEAVAAGVMTSDDDNYRTVTTSQWTAQFNSMDNGYYFYWLWNGAAMSRSMENLLTGLGGIPFPEVKDANGAPATLVYDDAGDPLTGNAENPLDPKANRVRVGVPSIVDPRGPVYYSVTSTASSASSDVVINGKHYNMLNRWVGVPAGLSPVNAGKPEYNNTDYARMSEKYTADERKYEKLTYEEVCFLRAEGAARGWNMGGTAQSFYEQGITASMKKNGIADDVITQYLQSTHQNTYGTTVKFGYNSGKSFNGEQVDTDLEKIITQKYIAMWPDGGLEAWNDHRRLHMPVLVPFASPDASSVTSTDGGPGNFIKRVTYPAGEQVSNEANYKDAIQRMGGSDKVTTNVWWDKD
jgi:hypothetical protein